MVCIGSLSSGTEDEVIFSIEERGTLKVQLFAGVQDIGLNASGFDDSSIDNLSAKLSALANVMADICLKVVIPGSTKKPELLIQCISLDIALVNVSLLFGRWFGSPRNLKILCATVIRRQVLFFESVLTMAVPLVSVSGNNWLVSPSDAKLVVHRFWDDG